MWPVCSSSEAKERVPAIQGRWFLRSRNCRPVPAGAVPVLDGKGDALIVVCSRRGLCSGGHCLSGRAVGGTIWARSKETSH